jgi:soluble lytic murein transglycosylase-like protein
VSGARAIRRARLLLPVVAALAVPLAVRAEVYSYIDGDGVIRVTNVRPTASELARYRGQAKAAPRRGAAAYDEHICAAAEQHGVPPPLLKAVVAVESNFDPAAVSAKGAAGLMQLMPGTARDLAVSDVLDPRQNIDGGARYLRVLTDRFGGDLEKALAAYNAGPEVVRRAGSSAPPFQETRLYVRRVLAARDGYTRARWCGGSRVQAAVATARAG